VERAVRTLGDELGHSGSLPAPLPTSANPRQNTGVLLKTSSLSIGSSSVLDVTNHDLIIGNTSYAAIQNEILNGFGAGTGGASITSSTSTGGDPTFLIPIDASASGLTSWDNVPIDQPNTIVIKYDTFGDASFDGLVNGDDITTVESNFGDTTPGLADIEQSWLLGDVNFDGVVDGNDITTIESNYGANKLISFSNLINTVSPYTVPEPASLAFLGVGVFYLMTKKHNKFC